MRTAVSYSVHPVGFIRSDLRRRDKAPRQGREAAPDAWLEVNSRFAEGMQDIVMGQEIILITWLHKAARKTLTVHPRADTSRPRTGVFSTRSPDRPNPIGLHRVKILGTNRARLHVGPIEAIDGTPVIDIKPVIDSNDS